MVRDRYEYVSTPSKKVLGTKVDDNEATLDPETERRLRQNREDAMNVPLVDIEVDPSNKEGDDMT